MSEHLDDCALVKRMLACDETAFEEFFALYFPGLYRFVLTRIGGDGTIAEEVVQAALCKAISKLNTYRGEAALFTWLCTFCRHQVSEYLRRENRLVPSATFLQNHPEVTAALESLLITSQQLPDQIVLRKELAHLVQLVLDALPPRYADVLELKYIEELAVKEIAERLNLSFKAVESLLTRAREAFKDAFTTFSTGLAAEYE